MSYKIVMDVTKFLNMLRTILKQRTVYFYGGYGQQMTQANIDRGCSLYAYNERRRSMYQALIGKGYWGFDCVNLVKGILWGWTGDTTKARGGAVYASNGVPDIGANSFFKLCKQSKDWSKIVPGDAVWVDGHFGVYMGDGLAIESTPNWKNGVQLTAVGNIGAKAGYPTRTWTAFGKIPFISYLTTPVVEKPEQGVGTGGGSEVIRIGDIVEFTGTTMYRSANASRGVNAKHGLAKVTAYAEGARFPYHVIATPDSESNLYGWVAGSTIKLRISSEKRIPKVGDIVHFKGTKHYTNAQATSGVPAKAGLAQVTHYVPDARNPFHVKAHKPTTSNVYGWVKAEDIDVEMPAPSNPIPPAEVPFNMILRKGSTGDDVRVLQYLMRVDPDGHFGPITEAAVIAFQESKNIIADGVVGDETWEMLRP